MSKVWTVEKWFYEDHTEYGPYATEELANQVRDLLNESGEDSGGFNTIELEVLTQPLQIHTYFIGDASVLKGGEISTHVWPSRQIDQDGTWSLPLAQGVQKTYRDLPNPDYVRDTPNARDYRTPNGRYVRVPALGVTIYSFSEEGLEQQLRDTLARYIDRHGWHEVV